MRDMGILRGERYERCLTGYDLRSTLGHAGMTVSEEAQFEAH